MCWQSHPSSVKHDSEVWGKSDIENKSKTFKAAFIFVLFFPDPIYVKWYMIETFNAINVLFSTFWKMSDQPIFNAATKRWWSLNDSTDRSDLCQSCWHQWQFLFPLFWSKHTHRKVSPEAITTCHLLHFLLIRAETHALTCFEENTVCIGATFCQILSPHGIYERCQPAQPPITSVLVMKPERQVSFKE